MEVLLHVDVNSMQIQRQVMNYGKKVEPILETETPPLKLGANEPVYGMMDGAMIFTREEGWKEVKLGRVFKERDLFSLNEKRNWLRTSEYIAHLGGHKDFEQKFGVVLDKYEHLDERLVFISDGARWIWNYVEAEYPKATQILDFYHAAEHLAKFSKFYFYKKDSEKAQKWLDRTRKLLKEQGVQSVLQQIERLEQKTPTIEVERQRLINYIKNNQKRMDYPTFIKRGLLIGSGAIEAAHRTVTQKRLKLSGQRWSKVGAQRVLNLRTIALSDRWDKLKNIIRQRA